MSSLRSLVGFALVLALIAPCPVWPAPQTGALERPVPTRSKARFNHPRDVAIDSHGNVFVTDLLNHTIRKITPDRVVTTFAGAAKQSGRNDGEGSQARFDAPYFIAIDSADNIWVEDGLDPGMLRKITPTGVVKTLHAVMSLGGDGVELWLFESDHPLEMTSAEGVVTRLAWLPRAFNIPQGLATDRAGNIYVSDPGNHTIMKLSPSGALTRLAGVAGKRGSTDGEGATASFRGPVGLATDSEGNVYVADRGNHTVRKITPEGVVSTFAGKAEQKGTADGEGPTARFHHPYDVATDGDGNVYVADGSNDTIRKITPAGVVATLAGTAQQPGSADGEGQAARFDFPSGLAVDREGNVYVADERNNTIRKITPAGVVTTLAGAPGQRGSSDDG